MRFSNMMKSISIALTTYNGALYITEQINSILNQNTNFSELIICDDNSTDKTRQILKKYANLDSRIKVHFNTDNLGFKRNFEKAISLCKSDYIALCDQDDIWLPNHLETLYNGIGDYMLACGESEIINSNGELQNIRLSSIKNYNKFHNNNDSIFRFIAFYQNPFQGASMMMRRDFAKLLLPIPNDVYYHDVWFAINACVLNSFIFIKEPITLYRLHNNNASGTHQHKSVIRTIAGHFLKKNLNTNRREIFEAIKVSENIPGEYYDLVQEALKYYKDRSIMTRINNLVFELSNYVSIYGTK